MATSQPGKSKRMPDNTCIGPDWMLTLQTTYEDARNVSRRHTLPKEPLQAHDVPAQPWECITMDHFYWQNRLYLLVCDYFSKFPFVFQAKSTSFANIKDQLEELFGLEGKPDEIMSDNGPLFSSKEFNSFLSGHGIKHTTSSPNYPQSNGFIERQIQTMKRLMEKANSTGRSFQEALTSLKATPIAEGMPSPADTAWEKPCYKKDNFC